MTEKPTYKELEKRIQELVRDINERKQVEKSMRESEEKWKSLISNSNDIIQILDIEANILYMNKVRPPHEMKDVIGKSALDFMNDESKKAVLQAIKKILKGGGAQTIEIAVNIKESFTVLFEARYVPMLIDGKVEKIIAIVNDITARKHAEKILKTSAAVFENMADGVTITDMQGQIIDVNKSTMKQHGYEKEEIIGRTPGELLLAERELPRYIEKLNLLASGKSHLNYEFIARRKDGTEFPTTVSLSTMMSADGEPEGVVAVHKDITEIKRAEKALLQIKTAVDNTSDAIGVATQDGSHFYQNKAFTQMFGYSVEEVKNLYPTVLYCDSNEGKDVFDTIMAGNLYSKEIEMVSKDGNQFPVAVRANAIKSTDGEIIGLVGVHTDITERKKADEKLHSALADAKKTSERLKEATDQANEMAARAEMANTAKSEFLANMSHEIRTPMNGVIGMAELLLDTELTDEQCDFAETVKASADSLLQLINDILDFSKIEAGKLDIEEIDFDIRSMMDDFATTMVFRTDEKGLEFICFAEPDIPPFVKGDPARLRQILTNLTGNAVKFTQKGEIAVSCSLEEELQGSDRFRFSIRDTGVGIPKDKQSALFEKFTQADSSTTREFGGTGLGLAISKQLSELMGGEIGIESEEGKGSTFWFTVELKNSDKKPEPLEIVDLSKANVLFIDGNKTNREVVGAMLSSWNIEHTLSASGNDGLDKLYGAYDKGNPFDIAILDMHTPKMDAAAVGKAIKRDEKLKKTHLVLLTSMSNRGDAARFKKEGFAAFLTKPIRRSYIYDCLTQVMGIGAYGDSAKETPLITRHSISENRRAKTRLLLVEDNATNRIVAKAILNKLGYSTDEAVDGLEALKALKEAKYDLVFMDIQMPVMDGIEATREIRNTKSGVLNHKIPIIALTANAMKGDREMCIKAGMDDYLAKPIITEKVIKVLEKWLPKDKVLRTESLEDAESAKNTGDNSTDNSEGPLLF